MEMYETNRGAGKAEHCVHDMNVETMRFLAGIQRACWSASVVRFEIERMRKRAEIDRYRYSLGVLDVRVCCVSRGV